MTDVFIKLLNMSIVAGWLVIAILLLFVAPNMFVEILKNAL